MFANLKNKIFDEVKASPAKFQQLAQAAQAAVSSTSSTSESVPGSDNFFSITEEDTPQNSPFKISKDDNQFKQLLGTNSVILPLNNGASMNRSRRLSNSSMTSDVSFRLPSYDSPAVYHLQSDLDISGSEHEDSASTSSRLDVISKEQLHDAYRKALDRYQKYRSRYTDLAKRYRDLERDSTKARSVLVETQDKAIRRISELREQCTLEQQAKAHLEEALRMEMDDMNCKIKAYQIKLKLLGENPENVNDSNTRKLSTHLIKNEDSLIKLESDNECLINLGLTSSMPESQHQSINLNKLNDRIKELETILTEKSDEIVKLNTNLHISSKKIETLRKREEDNSIILAQNKLEIHSELENKESAMTKLNLIITELESKYQQSEKDNNLFRIQTNQMAELKEKLKQMTEMKQEFEAKIISHEHIVGELKKIHTEKDKLLAKAKKSAEEQVNKISAEFEDKLKALKDQNDTLNVMLEQNNKIELNLAQIDNELNRTKTENNLFKEKFEQINFEKIELQNQMENIKKQLDQSLGEIEIKQNEENDLKRDNQEIKAKINELTKTLKETLTLNESFQNQIKQLEDELVILREQNEKTDSETVIALKETLQKTQNEVNNQIKTLKDQIENKETEIKVTISQTEQLKIENGKLKIQKTNEKEKFENNLKILKEKLKNSENKIVEIQNDVKVKEEKMEKDNSELKSQVVNILQEITKMEIQISEVKLSHSKLEEEKQNLEKKFEIKQNQNDETQKGSQRWQNLLKDAEDNLVQAVLKQQTVETENTQLVKKNYLLEENLKSLEKLINENDLILKKEKLSCKEAIQKAELELSSLRMTCDTATENERKLNEKNSQVLDENSRLHNAKELMEHEFRSIQDQCEEREKEKLCVLDSNKCLENEMLNLRTEIASIITEKTNLNEIVAKLQKDLATVTAKKQNDKEKREKVQTELKATQKSKENLEDELNSLKEKINESLQEDTLITELQEEIIKLKETIVHHERECKNLKSQITCLNQQFVEDVNKLEKSYKEKIDSAESEINAFQEKLTGLSKKNDTLKEENDSFKKELDTLNNQNQARLSELENLLKETNDHNQTLQQSVLNATDFEKKLQNYEQLKIENEYLNKLTNQLETDIRKQKDDKQKSEEEINQLKIKMKSQQCELYVLTENKEKHELEVAEKLAVINQLEIELKNLNETIEKKKHDTQNQLDHCNFISQQNDSFQKELLLYRTKLQEAEKLCCETKISLAEVITDNIQSKHEIEILKKKNSDEIEKLKQDDEENKILIAKLTSDLKNLKILLEKLENVENLNVQLENQVNELEIELAAKISSYEQIQKEKLEEFAIATSNLVVVDPDRENLQQINVKLESELEDLKYKTSAQISNLQQEIDDLTINSKHLSEKLTDFDVLKTQATKLTIELDKLKLQDQENDNNNSSTDDNAIIMKQERDDLQTKLNKIMNDVQDVSNRNLFLEQKCENYLILEQSNERLKLSNQKLSRQLDETLVSMQHNNEGIQANTEFEYLRNIMFQYLTGTVNGNNETLVKVIAAVLKFSPQQTQVAIEKEHQKNSLVLFK